VAVSASGTSPLGDLNRGRAGRQAWLDQGLVVLSRLGDDGLTMERLCHQRRKTRGSFHHHFADICVYQQALLEHWRARHTRALIEATRRLPTASARRGALDELATSLDPRVETAMRAWAQTDPRAARTVAEVDRERIDHLIDLHRRSGFSGAAAQELAILEYTTFIGWLTNFPDTPAPLRSRVLGRWTALLKTAARK
jgi:hypothetical protein